LKPLTRRSTIAMRQQDWSYATAGLAHHIGRLAWR
jgi:hypothetical protein